MALPTPTPGIGPGIPGVVPTLTADDVDRIVAKHANSIMNYMYSIGVGIFDLINNVSSRQYELLNRVDASVRDLYPRLDNVTAALINLASHQSLLTNMLNMSLMNLTAGLQGVGVGLAHFGLGMNNLALSLMNIGNTLMVDSLNRSSLYTRIAEVLALIPPVVPALETSTQLINEFLRRLLDPEERKKLLEEIWRALVEVFSIVLEKLAEPFKTQLAELMATLSALSQATSASDASGVLATMSMIYGKYTDVVMNTLALGLLIELSSLGQLDQVARTMMDALRLLPISRVGEELFYLEYDVGVRPKIIQYLRQKHLPEIPSPSELITMVVREAFDPNFVTPAPEVFKQYMKLQGFAEEWSDRFWTAHWRWVPNEVAIEMFHRGIITLQDLHKTFVINDIHPKTLEWWTKYIYRLPNRVEARIMGRFGLLTEEQMDRILKAEGIDPEFIPALRTMIFEYHLGSIQTKIESFAISSYEEGMISSEVFRQWMTVARFPENVINMAQTLAQYKRAIELRDRKRKLIKEYAKRGYLSYEQAAASLQALGIEPDVLTLDIEEIVMHRFFGQEREIESLYDRILNSALSAYDDGLLNRNEFVNILKSMNLPERIVNAYASLAEYRRIWGLRGEVVRAYLSLYRRGAIDFEGALQGMINAGVDPDFAYAKLVAVKQTIEVTKPPKLDLPGDKLTLKQILDALNLGLITLEQAIEFLRNKGYDPTEIAVIINTWILKQAGG